MINFHQVYLNFTRVFLFVAIKNSGIHHIWLGQDLTYGLRRKYPNREDLSSKVSMRNWCKDYLIVGESPAVSWRISLPYHTKLLKLSLERLTTKGTSKRVYAFSKSNNFETLGKNNNTYCVQVCCGILYKSLKG